MAKLGGVKGHGKGRYSGDRQSDQWLRKLFAGLYVEVLQEPLPTHLQEFARELSATLEQKKAADRM